MIRVILPAHLQALARISGEVQLDISQRPTVCAILNELESIYPMLRGTMRDHGTQKRRPYIRFFACGRDLSHETPDVQLPDSVAGGTEPLLIVGAIAGG